MILKVVNTFKYVWSHPLSEGRKIRSVVEFLVRQTTSRILRGDLVVEYPSGSRLSVPVEMKGAWHYIWPGLFQLEDMSLVVHFLRKGDVFGDVGANIGAFTVLASRVAGASSVAFEPGGVAFDALAGNVAINGIQDSVVLHRAVVGRTEGVRRFLDGYGTESRVAAEEDSGKTVDVRMVSLDAQAPKQGFTALKIDTEGFESEVIAGAAGVIRNPSLKLIILESAGNGGHYNADEAAIETLLTREGFLPCEYSPSTRKLTPAPARTGGCVAYVRDMEFVSERVSSAPRFRYKHIEL